MFSKPLFLVKEMEFGHHGHHSDTDIVSKCPSFGHHHPYYNVVVGGECPDGEGCWK